MARRNPSEIHVEFSRSHDPSVDMVRAIKTHLDRSIEQRFRSSDFLLLFHAEPIPQHSLASREPVRQT